MAQISIPGRPVLLFFGNISLSRISNTFSFHLGSENISFSAEHKLGNAPLLLDVGISVSSISR